MRRGARENDATSETPRLYVRLLDVLSGRLGESTRLIDEAIRSRCDALPVVEMDFVYAIDCDSIAVALGRDVEEIREIVSGATEPLPLWSELSLSKRFDGKGAEK